MKKCIHCEREKDIDDFYRHVGMDDGHLNICKKCHKERMNNIYSRKSIKDKAIHRYSKYRARARYKNMDFDISRDDFVEMVFSDCHYCGSSPEFSDHKINGVDRMDNDLGYIPGNIVSCCKICNRAKNTMLYEEFLEWVNRIKGIF